MKENGKMSVEDINIKNSFKWSNTLAMLAYQYNILFLDELIVKKYEKTMIFIKRLENRLKKILNSF